MPYKNLEERKAYDKAYQKEWYQKHKNDPGFKERKRILWKRWYEKNKEKRKKYHREHSTGANGNRIRGEKREYTGFCELCDKTVENNLHYHHWDDSNMMLGIWVCGRCHRWAHGFDNISYFKKYIDLKNKIIGSQSGPEVQPKEEWVQSIIDNAEGVPIFMKSSLEFGLRLMESPNALDSEGEKIK